MAELLLRGWNVALPEVDIGEDVFVIKDDTGDLSRVQVKTGTAKAQRDGYSAQFSVSLRQLRRPRTPDLVYIFAVRHGDRWEPFVVIDRSALREEHELYGAGSSNDESVVFRVVLSGPSLSCSGRDFRAYRDAWSRWPFLSNAFRISS
jgi:hypothetical protein